MLHFIFYLYISQQQQQQKSTFAAYLDILLKIRVNDNLTAEICDKQSDFRCTKIPLDHLHKNVLTRHWDQKKYGRFRRVTGFVKLRLQRIVQRGLK
jgi:hypothetical protein